MRTTGWNLTPKTVSAVTKADPAVVTVTAHGFPDIGDAGTHIEPEIYFTGMAGMTELNGNVYKAVYIDANSFSLKTLAGANVDSTGYGTFTSGECGRANNGYIAASDNTIILKSGKTASTDIYRYDLGDYTLAELQALDRTDEPGASNMNFETGTVISS